MKLLSIVFLVSFLVTIVFSYDSDYVPKNYTEVGDILEESWINQTFGQCYPVPENPAHFVLRSFLDQYDNTSNIIAVLLTEPWISEEDENLRLDSVKRFETIAERWNVNSRINFVALVSDQASRCVSFGTAAEITQHITLYQDINAEFQQTLSMSSPSLLILSPNMTVRYNDFSFRDFECELESLVLNENITSPEFGVAENGCKDIVKIVHNYTDPDAGKVFGHAKKNFQFSLVVLSFGLVILI